MNSSILQKEVEQVRERVLQRMWPGFVLGTAQVTSQVTSTSAAALGVSASVPTTNGFGSTRPISVPSVSFANARKRPFIIAPDLMRGELTVMASHGGAGKSSHAVVTCLAAATGRPLLNRSIIGGPVPVLYVNAEDSSDEMTRRIVAAALLHGVSESELSNFYLLCADNWQTLQLSFVTSERQGQAINQSAFDFLDSLLAELRPAIVVLDPLIALCGTGNMNDNAVMGSVMRSLKLVAQKRHAAIEILHHTRKGGDASSADSIGGASAIVNLARRAVQIAPMTPEEALKNHVLPSERSSYFRVVATKSNLVPAATGSTDWFRMSSVTLPNAEPPLYPLGDNVQAVELVVLPSRTANFSQTEQIATTVILSLVDKGKNIDGRFFPYSPSLSGAVNKRSIRADAVAAVMTAQNNAIASSDVDALVTRLVKSMIADGRLVVETIPNGTKFRRGIGLRTSSGVLPAGDAVP